MLSENEAWAAFRVDGDSVIGTGHIMRCLSLATAAQARGLYIRLLTRSLDDRLLPRIRAANVELYRLPSPATDTRTYSERPYAHSDWLAVTETRDAADCHLKLKELSELYGPPAFIAVDHYALGGPWHETLRPIAPVLAIDELGDRPMASDWLVDQTEDKQASDYASLTADFTQCLIGGQYSLLRPEFANQAAAMKRQRLAIQSPLRVLITMGGVDPDNASATALSAIDIVAQTLPIETTLVIGSTSSHRAELRQMIKSMSTPINLVIDSENMAELMADHHLAIGAAGTSAWERCALGLPSLNLILARNQAGVSTWIANTGAALDMGWAKQLQPEMLANEIIHLAKDPDLYQGMVAAAFKVTDGRGCERVLDTILTAN
jgi:UDP-2,4-diacetamido-2,4,6-trideoxy-beta-L-altropyranose hydrolase